MGNIKASQVFNGTFAEVWLDDEKISEVTGISAKVELETEDVQFCGSLASDRKVVGYKCNGSLKFHKISSRFTKSLGEALKTGIELEHTIIMKLSDPAADGSERVALQGVKFDDLELFNVEVKTLMKTERAFSFTGWEYLDAVE